MSTREDCYQLYVLDQSYYSGKFHSYLRYKQIPITLNEIDYVDWWKTGYSNTGLMKMPFVRTPEGQWLQDSTPMIDWFEKKYSQSSILPSDPYLQFFCRLVEDYADEWHWRPAMHYRWSYAADAAVNSIRFRDKLLARIPGTDWTKSKLAKWRQYHEFVANDGVDEATREHVESIYLRNLDWLEAILQQQPFLLGNKPCLADFGFMGPMFRHYSIDPTPAKLMRDRAPHVYLWVARMWATHASELDQQQWFYREGELPRLWQPIIQDICEAYLPYLLANARAWRDKKKFCEFTVQGVHYRKARCYDYRVWCREQLLMHFRQLPDSAQQQVKQTLQQYGGWEAFMSDADIRSGLSSNDTAPVRQALEPDLARKLLRFFTGTPWNTPW